MIRPTKSPAQQQLDLYRDEMRRRNHVAYIDPETEEIEIIDAPMPEEDTTVSDYKLKRNPIRRGLEGVGMVLYAFFAFLFTIGSIIGMVALLIGAKLIVWIITSARHLIPLAILILLAIIAYKLWQL